MSPRRKREPAAGGGVPGSTEAKRLAAGVLEVLSGLRGPQETSKLLGISLTRYYQLERRSLAGLIAALERRPKGRRRSTEDELSALRRDKQRLEQELGRVQALLRADNLKDYEIFPGEYATYGDTTLRFLAGWGEWNGDEGPDASELRNVISIVTKLEYRGRSVLLTGDTIGRRRTDQDGACKDAEARMVDWHNEGRIDLQSDVLVAPHHGGNNGSSGCFIEAVQPTFVVFSAGHDYEHPKAETAGRYLARGMDEARMFRTDRGDDEGGEEWDGGRRSGCRDKRGDDDVEIVIRENGDVEVEYRTADGGC